MPDFRYRLFFDNKPASNQQLDTVKEVIVEQEVDMAWEARIKISIFTNDKGEWTAEDGQFMTPFSRVRVEISNGENSYVALIDGPIVGHETTMSSEPGQSSITLVVNDDSAFLNRKDTMVQYESLKDTEIVEQIFRQSQHIDSVNIEESTSPNPKLPVVIQRGTAMQVLRSLATRHGMHAFILPGKSPGKSIGCFQHFFTKEDDRLEPLILLGEEANISTFNVKNEATRASRFYASHLDFTDKTIKSAESSFQDAELLGSEPVLAGDPDDTLQILRNDEDLSQDLDQYVASKAKMSSYVFEATGSVHKFYTGVLQPYRTVTIMGVNGRLSGDYEITSVTHKLTDAAYSQSFTVRRNARSAGSDNDSNGLLRGGIF